MGERFAKIGEHEIFYGVPRPSEYTDKNLRGQIGTNAEAALTAEIILLAVPYESVADALAECGDLTGKIVIDATNPLRFADGRLSLTVGFETSGAEKIAALVSGAKVVKCFNQTGFGNMAEPRYTNGKSVMFVCGDDRAANEIVRQFAESIGFETVAAGNLESARLLEPLAMLWIHLSLTTELKRKFAFGLLKSE